jgi:hypothetical protein
MEFATRCLKLGQNGKTIYNKLVVICQLLKQHGSEEDPQRERLAEFRPDRSANL